MSHNLQRDKQTSGGTHSGYKLTSILWHALDLWQCVKLGSPNLKEAVADMLKCTNGFDSENWYLPDLMYMYTCYVVWTKCTIAVNSVALSSVQYIRCFIFLGRQDRSSARYSDW